MSDGVSEQTAEAASRYDEYERFARGNPIYAGMEGALSPLIADTVKQMESGGE